MLLFGKYIPPRETPQTDATATRLAYVRHCIHEGVSHHQSKTINVSSLSDFATATGDLLNHYEVLVSSSCEVLDMESRYPGDYKLLQEFLGILKRRNELLTTNARLINQDLDKIEQRLESLKLLLFLTRQVSCCVIVDCYRAYQKLCYHDWPMRKKDAMEWCRRVLDFLYLCRVEGNVSFVFGAAPNERDLEAQLLSMLELFRSGKHEAIAETCVKSIQQCSTLNQTHKVYACEITPCAKCLPLATIPMISDALTSLEDADSFELPSRRNWSSRLLTKPSDNYGQWQKRLNRFKSCKNAEVDKKLNPACCYVVKKNCTYIEWYGPTLVSARCVQYSEPKQPYSSATGNKTTDAQAVRNRSISVNVSTIYNPPLQRSVSTGHWNSMSQFLSQMRESHVYPRHHT